MAHNYPTPVHSVQHHVQILRCSDIASMVSPGYPPLDAVLYITGAVCTKLFLQLQLLYSDFDVWLRCHHYGISPASRSVLLLSNRSFPQQHRPLHRLYQTFHSELQQARPLPSSKMTAFVIGLGIHYRTQRAPPCFWRIAELDWEICQSKWHVDIALHNGDGDLGIVQGFVIDV
jgi:hypothetical protein